MTLLSLTELFIPYSLPNGITLGIVTITGTLLYVVTPLDVANYIITTSEE